MNKWKDGLEDLRLQAHENWGNSTWLDAGHLVAIEAAQECILELESQLAAEREKYSDLIMQVQKKIPGETRHETAKRIIQQHEARENWPAQATAPEQAAAMSEGQEG